MPKYIDLSGKKFGALTVISITDKRDKRGLAYWLCKCECGKETVVLGRYLRNGHTKSCGCHIQNIKSKYRRKGERIYSIWCGINKRINVPRNVHYKDYGGRGITICDEWKDYDNFFEWAMANGYQDDLTIERIDVNGNYEPSNCTWIPMALQQNNTRRTVKVNFCGREMTITEIANELGVSRNAIKMRLRKNKSLEGKYKDIAYVKTISN